MTSIYVGNLAHTATEKDVQDAFSQHGNVAEVKIITDRATGSSRGFAFVEMPDASEASNAIQQMNLVEICGRSVTVSEARPKTGGDRPRGGGGGGGRRRSW